MNNSIKLAISSLFLTTALLHNPCEAEEAFTLTSGIDYFTGKYGQTQSTDMTYIPLIAKYEINSTTLKLTVPWLKITGPGDVVGGSDPIVIGKTNLPITSQSGLGDIVFSATQTVAQFGESHPLILDVTGKVKFGTASTSKNLGTGKNDYTIALDAYKPLNSNATLFGGVGYKVLGDPTGIDLNNVWLGSLGFNYKLAPSTNVAIMADFKQASQNTTQPLRELTLAITHKINTHYKLQSFLSHGYSDASADWGGGVLLAWTF